ncbi:carbon-nitrogen hydrolase family protein [Flectobacillus sp. BAB-3569]|uniref:carbon-nitrogen hydrolase family protein n=1 Tax=Flectobacillus sp. BAB-3569 TaxID=1509483 RepID=UPI001E658A33|nr:nitrilase-related carbon-nitrogen hydrolase [Flectobacillus sp. BAB-3569]
MTSYEPKLALALASHLEDKQFDVFQEISDHNNITIGIGMPEVVSNGVKISLFIFQPNRPRKAYSKQHLHSDEYSYFIKGEDQVTITVNDEKIVPAICYESLLLSHFESGVELGAEIYVASVAKSQIGINKATTHYSAMAKKFSMPVLLSNCLGFCDNFESVGQSAIWRNDGVLAGQLNSTDEGILIFDTKTEEVLIQIL